jgi:hypothetical protein
MTCVQRDKTDAAALVKATADAGFPSMVHT